LRGDDATPAARRRAGVNLAAAVLCGAVGVRFGADWVLPAFLVLAASLLVVTVIDLEHFVIPNRVVYPTLALALPLLAVAAAAEHR
jgi:leader peptidase (prepilin peptidase)/N-methyltransferase